MAPKSDFDSQDDDFDSHDDLDSVEIRPGVGFYNLIPHLRYTPWVALGELVDNSIQSYATNRDALRELHGRDFRLRIDIDFHNGDEPWISITDNAAGIAVADFKRAFTPATPPPDKSGVSQYGIGMKSSSRWFSNYFIVTSKALNELESRTVVFDIAKIISENLETLRPNRSPKSPEEHGTSIELRQLIKPIPVSGSLSRIKTYLRSIYRDWLRSGEVILSVGGEILKYESPKWLESPYWPSDKGPGDGPTISWVKEIDFLLDETANLYSPTVQKDEIPRIRGFVAIMEKGATRKAGLSLIWRRKIVVGAGGEAESQDDLYRPDLIFGGTNSFERQRIFGEIDVSMLRVTAFKDAIDWSSEQENEFLRKLKDQLSDPSKPILKMTRNYRATARDKEIDDTISDVIQDAAGDATTSIIEAVDSDVDGQKLFPEIVTSESPEPDTDKTVPIRRATLILQPTFEENVVLEVKDQAGDSAWLRVNYEDSRWRITLNRAHPFMNSFVSNIDSEFEPVVRIALAIGLAEITGRNSGKADPDFVRLQVNSILRDWLAHKGSIRKEM